jgi:selenide,water dikinase
VYLIDEHSALVQTVDFFTPIVDDPRTFGEIAASNSLSDVYAMGGRPISALSIVGFPEKGDPQILAQILQGGLAKMMEAKCTVIGGHSVRNEDVLFGYAVTGLIDPKRVWKNVGARTGDMLLYTKLLRTGVISTALKNDKAPADAVSAAIHSMSTLNRAAAKRFTTLNRKRNLPTLFMRSLTSRDSAARARARNGAGKSGKGIETVSLRIRSRAVHLFTGRVAGAWAGTPGGFEK